MTEAGVCGKSAAFAALSVAPVVTTSSTISMCWLAIAAADEVVNTFSTLVSRSVRFRLVW